MEAAEAAVSRVVGAGVTRWVPARHGRERLVIGLHYAMREPLEVRLQVTADNVWRFARRLLHDGAAGRDRNHWERWSHDTHGDVYVYPEWLDSDGGAPSRVGIRLTSFDGTAHLDLPKSDVVAFLADTYRLVPQRLESERVARIIDDELATLLRDGAT